MSSRRISLSSCELIRVIQKASERLKRTNFDDNVGVREPSLLELNDIDTVPGMEYFLDLC
jgi:hypothetical protein